MQEMLIQVQMFVYLNSNSSQSSSTKHLKTSVNLISKSDLFWKLDPSIQHRNS